MKEKIHTDGLVIKENHIGESDRLITVLTRNEGVVHSFATGARKITGKSMSATQLLCFSDFVFTRKKDTYRVTEAEAVEVFFDLRNDIEKLSLAQYFCELAGALAPVEEPAEEYLRLILNSLKFLADNRLPPAQIKAVFELYILSLSGYMPDLSECPECGKEKNLCFDMSEGQVFCQEHASVGAIQLSDSVLSAMRFITMSEFSKIFFFSLPDEALNDLENVCENYLKIRLERTFKTLDFYNSVKLI